MPNHFRDTIIAMEIVDSARKHGASDDSIRHAIEHALVSHEAGEEPLRPKYRHLLP